MSHAFGDRSSLPLLAEIETLKTVLYNLADGVIVADSEGRFLFFNQAAQTILGIGMQDAPVDRWAEVYGCFLPDRKTPFPPRDLPLARALRGEKVAETEIFVRNPMRTGGVWILARAKPLWNEAGDVRGGVVIFCDITDKKGTEAQIRTLTNAVEQTADSIVITDRGGRIEYVNPAFEQTTGYTREEILGRNPRFLKSGLHERSFYQNLWDSITAGRTFRATITNRKKGGEIYFAEQTITPMRENDGSISHFVAVIKDVTELRKVQEQEAQMKLARAVQQQFYKIPPPRIPGFDLAGAAFPADATGGDYFDFVTLAGDGIGVSIADVCGHGVSSALLMVELRAYLRAFARRGSDAGEILSLLNNALTADLEEGQFATMLLCHLHPSSRSLAFANAGHVPGFILNSSGKVKHVLDATDIPLGLFPDRPIQSSEKILLEPGGMLVLLTDGITEAENPDRIPFGSRRALHFIVEHRTESASEIISGLYRAVREYANGLPQADDITVVICKSVSR